MLSSKLVLSALLCLSASLATPVPQAPGTRVTHEGWGTWYYPGLGACGWDNSQSDLVVAISHDVYGSGGNCGQYMEITYNGVSQYAQTVDECEACDATDLDMSPALFQGFSDLSVGKIENVEWHFMSMDWLP